MRRNPDLSPEVLAGMMAEELHRLGAIKIPVFLDPTSAVQLVAQLQLAQRHPENAGVSSELGTQIIAKVTEFLRASGFVAHAYLADLGNVLSEPVCARCGAAIGSSRAALAEHRCERKPLVLVRSS
jgi:hypothetical protein